MKKKIFFIVSLFVISIILVACAVLMFSQVPNTEIMTPKDAALTALSIMLCIFAMVGVMGGLVVIGISLDD